MPTRAVLLVSLGLLVACDGTVPEAPISSSTYEIRNGTRDPQLIALTDGEQLAIGWLHTPGFPNEPFCTGTLIRGSVVLTAAHCLRDKSTDQITFSVGLLTTEPKGSFAVSQAFAHPSLDLGVLYLQQDVSSVLPVQPITPNLTDLDPVAEKLVAEPAEAAGYGYTWDPALTGRFFAMLAVTEITDKHVIVNGQGLQGLCQGDSGAPLLVPSATGAPVLIAVEERGEESCVGQDWMVRIDIAEEWLLPALGGEKADNSFVDPNAQVVSVEQKSNAIRGCDQTGSTAPLWALFALLLLRRERHQKPRA